HEERDAAAHHLVLREAEYCDARSVPHGEGDRVYARSLAVFAGANAEHVGAVGQTGRVELELRRRVERHAGRGLVVDEEFDPHRSRIPSSKMLRFTWWGASPPGRHANRTACTNANATVIAAAPTIIQPSAAVVGSAGSCVPHQADQTSSAMLFIGRDPL